MFIVVKYGPEDYNRLVTQRLEKLFKHHVLNSQKGLVIHLEDSLLEFGSVNYFTYDIVTLDLPGLYSQEIVDLANLVKERNVHKRRQTK